MLHEESFAVNSHCSDEALILMPTDRACKQFINRLKASNEKYGPNADNRKEVIVPRAFQFTLSGQKFYLDDSHDDDRIIIFSSQQKYFQKIETGCVTEHSTFLQLYIDNYSVFMSSTEVCYNN